MNQKPTAGVPHINSDDNVILFDGVCKLCNAWSNFIIQHDKQHCFKLASVQSQQGKDILQHFDYPTDCYKTMLVVSGNQCFEKSDSFLLVMQKLGWPWKALLVFKIIPKALRDWMYDRIALNRYQIFGKYDYCILPNPDHDQRYLDGNSAAE